MIIHTPDGSFELPVHSGNVEQTAKRLTINGREVVLDVLTVRPNPTVRRLSMPAAATAKLGLKQIPPDVLEVLRSLHWHEGKCKILAKLDPKLYKEVDKVLQAAGGKWNRKEQSHLFADGDGEMILRESIETGKYIDEKKAFQFFETPADVATQVAAIADRLFFGERVDLYKPYEPPRKEDKEVLGARAEARYLEPSAGTGNLCAAMYELGYTRGSAHDINDKYLTKLKKRLPGVVGVSQCDFLQVNPPSKAIACFDIVVMNPPFHGLADVKHVLHAASFLKPGGVLVAVMCPAWTYRQHKDIERLDELRRECELNAWNLLPEGAFTESGTGVRTGILALKLK